MVFPPKGKVARSNRAGVTIDEHFCRNWVDSPQGNWKRDLLPCHSIRAWQGGRSGFSISKMLAVGLWLYFQKIAIGGGLGIHETMVDGLFGILVRRS